MAVRGAHLRTEEGRRFPVYVRPVPRAWWLETGPYRRFAARELTAVFVAAFAVILLLMLFALSRGREAYEGYLRWLELPGIAVMHGVILVAVLYHTVTWFLLTAHVQEVRIGGKAVRLTAALFGTWILVSELVAYLNIWL